MKLGLLDESEYSEVQKTKAEKIGDKSAEQVQLKSKLNGPIQEMSLMQKSLLFAEISLVAYMEPAECSKAAGRLGFTDGKYFDRDGSQAYWLTNDVDSVVVFRGTEPTEWNDIKADLHAFFALAETVGHVHRGFKTEVDDLWPMLEKALMEDERDLWFTGHSLGGAMACISAGRCLLSHIPTEPEGIFTYGAPRIGNKRYVNYTEIPHVRWVNNNDVVPTVPPAWLGYRHYGDEYYINKAGRVKMLKGWRRTKDKLQGFLQGLAQFRIDNFSDHLMPYYIDAIDKEVKKETSG